MFELGASKYGAFNWRDDEVSASVYYDAALRHMACYFDGQVNDEESGQPHLSHVMACCSILIDAEAHGKLNDDRPKGGKIADIIKALTRPI